VVFLQSKDAFGKDRSLSKLKKIKYTYDFAIATSPENGGGGVNMKKLKERRYADQRFFQKAN